MGKIQSLSLLYYARMLPSPEPDSLPSHPDFRDPAFEEALLAVERSLQELKERYTQVEQDHQIQASLAAQAKSLQTQLSQSNSPDLQVELRKIEQHLEELEVRLESRLVSWTGFQEVFWQVVRFGGLGIVIGWSLAFYVLKKPAPTPVHPTPQSLTPQPLVSHDTTDCRNFTQRTA